MIEVFDEVIKVRKGRYMYQGREFPVRTGVILLFSFFTQPSTVLNELTILRLPNPYDVNEYVLNYVNGDHVIDPITDSPIPFHLPDKRFYYVIDSPSACVVKARIVYAPVEVVFR